MPDTTPPENNSPESGANPQVTPPAEPVFSLGRFESNCYARNHEAAAREFMALLGMLDRNYGALDPGFVAKPTANLGGADQDPHIINRICSALSALFSDPQFNLSFEGFRQMLFLHRWIATLFAASSFRNADHILRALNLNGPDAADVQVAGKDLIKFCLLFTPNSEIPLNFDALWAFDKNLAAALGCALISPRFLGTPAAHHKREVLLSWLPQRLDDIDDLDVLPVGVLHDVYMHCSYADLPAKHAIKAPINRLVRKKLLQQGHRDLIDPATPRSKRAKGQKPVMLVLLEWFSGAHSIYRTHSKSIVAAREQFHVIGIGNAGQVDDLGKAVFDEFHEVQGEHIAFVRDQAQRLQPDLIYYPAFGMFPHSIFLTNLRLAPVQVVSYGHPATSMSPFIDYFVLPEDWVGDPKCFSEKLLPLPRHAMPFVPSAATIPIEPKLRQPQQEVHIAVAATTMKLNPTFLAVLQRIQQEAARANRPARFHFFMGFSRGLVYLEVRQFILNFIPDATIHTHLPYDQYISQMNECDMYLNPFPFGNTNGITDTTSIGLVGVNKTGPEVLEHIDEAMFRRLGFPEWTIAKTHDEYIQAALRLITDDAHRLELRREVIAKQGVNVFYEGDGKGFGLALRGLVK
jgi:hypothetical protein